MATFTLCSKSCLTVYSEGGCKVDFEDTGDIPLTAESFVLMYTSPNIDGLLAVSGFSTTAEI